MMLPTNVQLKFHRREAPCTEIVFVAFAAEFERSLDSGPAAFVRIPSLNSCRTCPSIRPARPGRPASDGDTELGAELIGAPTTAASRSRLFAFWRADREAFSIAPASVPLARLR